MPLCPNHPDIYVLPGRTCSKCSDQNYLDWKAQAKAEKAVFKKKNLKSKPKSTSNKTKLKNKLQSLVAARFKKRFKGTPLFYCWITGKSTMREGLFGLHCSHFYARNKIWQLANHPHNVFPSTYNENVINQSSVTSARGMMEKVYGVEAIKELDRLAEYYRDAMNKGIENKTPSEIQLIAMIEETKRQS